VFCERFIGEAALVRTRARETQGRTAQEEMLMRNILVVCISLPVSALRTR
jgi:hypothetical protein